MIGRNSFQSAYCDWLGDSLVFDPATPASRFARSIADAPEDTRKHVRFPVEHIGIAEFALGDKAYVRRNVGMSGTCPLAIDDFVKIVGPGCICWLHLIDAIDLFQSQSRDVAASDWR